MTTQQSRVGRGGEWYFAAATFSLPLSCGSCPILAIIECSFLVKDTAAKRLNQNSDAEIIILRRHVDRSFAVERETNRVNQNISARFGRLQTSVDIAAKVVFAVRLLYASRDLPCHTIFITGSTYIDLDFGFVSRAKQIAAQVGIANLNGYVRTATIRQLNTIEVDPSAIHPGGKFSDPEIRAGYFRQSPFDQQSVRDSGVASRDTIEVDVLNGFANPTEPRQFSSGRNFRNKQRQYDQHTRESRHCWKTHNRYTPLLELVNQTFDFRPLCYC